MYQKFVFRVKIIIFAIFSDSVQSIQIYGRCFYPRWIACHLLDATWRIASWSRTHNGGTTHTSSAAAALLGFKPNSYILNIKAQHPTFCCIKIRQTHKHDSVSSSFGVFSSLFKGFNQLTRLKIVSTMLSPALAMTESGERRTGETPVWPYHRIKSRGK